MSDNEDVLRLLFPIELGGDFDGDIGVDGRSLDAAQARGEDLLVEMFADTAFELLSCWERVCGITPGADWPLQARTAAVVAKLRALGDCKRPALVAAASGLGYTITIDDCVPFMAGWGSAGDAVYVQDAIYIWCVSVIGQPSYLFRAGQSGSGEMLCWFNPPADLEALLGDLKPAEVYLYFVYP